MAQEVDAAAVGVNCMAADGALPGLMGELRRCTNVSLLCKPNAGRAVNGAYPVGETAFAAVMKECAEQGGPSAGRLLWHNAGVYSLPGTGPFLNPQAGQGAPLWARCINAKERNP